MSAVNHMKMYHDVDPVRKTLNELGDLSGFDVLYNNVLVATYLRPEKTASGFILPEKTRDEDLYQGVAALVVKTGPLAFLEDEGIEIHGRKIAVGDWVMIRPSDGLRVNVNGRHCRLVSADHVRMRVPAPDAVF